MTEIALLVPSGDSFSHHSLLLASGDPLSGLKRSGDPFGQKAFVRIASSDPFSHEPLLDVIHGVSTSSDPLPHGSGYPFADEPFVIASSDSLRQESGSGTAVELAGDESNEFITGCRVTFLTSADENAFQVVFLEGLLE